MFTTSNLPGKSYSELVGRDDVLEEIITALRDPSGRLIVAIDGVGGIGKTALAREIAEHCILGHFFDAVIWDQPLNKSQELQSAKGTLRFETILDSIARQLGALDVPRLKDSEKEIRVKTLLHTQRVLIVLDNLSASEESQIEILHRLDPLLNPSKVLITSRHRFQGNVYTIHLTGLDEDGSLRFIHKEAQGKNIKDVANAKSSELKQIAEATGGLPLVLKLIVGQLEHLPLKVVLDELRTIRPSIDSDKSEYVLFYKSIFSPFWKRLSSDAKMLLIAMTTFSPSIGGTFEAVKAVSDLGADELVRSIDELYLAGFLEISDSSSERKVRYYLHALTYHFLLSDIVKL
jgi:hypothetical protein